MTIGKNNNWQNDNWPKNYLGCDSCVCRDHDPIMTIICIS